MKRCIVILLLVGIQSSITTSKDFAWTDFEPTLASQCPYTAFCNGTAQMKVPANVRDDYGPCCNPCSCSADCGAVGNCCYKDLDTRNTFDHLNTSCVLTAYGNRDLLPSDPHYSMITQCRLNNQNEDTNITDCLQYDQTQFGSVHPVSSPSSGFTFANMFCARCNGVSDAVMWNRTVFCRPHILQPHDIFAGLAKGSCVVSDIPPKVLGYQPEQCKPDMVSRCNVTGRWKTYDNFTDLGCQQVYAPVQGPRGSLLSNIFCHQCNFGGSSAIKALCRTDGRWSSHEVSLTVLLDLDDVFQRPTDGESTSPQRQICVPVPARNDTERQIVCLPVYCPDGKFRRGKDCVPSFDRFINVNKCDLALKLTYVNSNRVSVAFTKASTDIDIWMTTIRGILPITDFYSLGVFYRQEVNSDQIEYIGFSMRVALSLPGNDWNELLEVIEQTFQKQWIIPLGNVSVPMNLSFFESPMTCSREKCFYTVIDKDTLNKEITSNSTGTTRYVVDTLYRVFHVTPHFLTITRMMYCEQAELASHMFTEDKYTVVLKEWGVRVYPNQMKKIRKGNATFIRICADQLPNSLTSSTDTEPANSDTTVVLGWLTLVCAVMSAVSLILTIVVHLSKRELLNSQGGRNVITLCILLLIAQLLFTFGTGQTDTGVICVVLGVLVHLSWLAAVFWMFVCCVFIALKLLPTTPVTTHEPAVGKFVVSLLAVFGLAAVFVGVNIAVSYALIGQVGYGKELCYIDTALMRLVTFAIPIGLVVISNVGMFIAVVIRLERDLLTIGNVRQTKDKLLIYARLSALTGVTWITGYVYHIEALRFFQYIFVILNAGQGVFVFASFILRRRVLRQIYQQCITQNGEETRQ